ncbi:hypothetical protein D5086_007466 [Populus alba]|uniref:Uncharacterized protein n=1 Tax=Populus alba TaxID=43335 RepID=A0ACC4CNM0_POPAL
MAQERISSFDLDFVDDFYFSALFDEEQEGGGGGEIFEVSDDRYAEELQFQEALMGSVIVSQMKNNGPSSMMVEGTPVLLRISDQPMQKEIIQSGAAESSLSFCEICVERKESDKMFKTESCVHSFCNDCISRHVAAKVQYGARVVTCPGLNCRAVLDLDTCRPILTRDCSALLIDDNEAEAIRESECPVCHRLFCALCSVPWHSGIECEEFQRLNEDERGREDLMLRELAKDKKWSRCPQCKFYVERTEGCPHMICRLIIISGVGLSFAMDVEQDGLDQIMVDALGNKKQHQALERFRTNRSTKAGDQASVMVSCTYGAKMYEKDGISRDEVVSIVNRFPNQVLDFYGALRSRIYDRSISKWVDDIEGVDNLGKGLPVFTPPEQTVEALLESGYSLIKEHQLIETSVCFSGKNNPDYPQITESNASFREGRN